jgi:tetratricopeptide (TPR) repeat protein
MKKLFILLLFSFTQQFVFAQVPSQAEIDKMMKDANALMKKYSNDPAVKKAMKNQQGNNTGATTAFYNSDPGAYGNVDNWKFPPKNTALLSALPKKIFTKTELVNFLNDLYGQLSKKLTSGVAASVQTMTTSYKNDGNKMGDVAIMGWYSSHPEEAILLIVKAAAINPDNGVLLNNCAALLNLSGIEQKAIPILKYLLQSYPDNSMLLNNLGQAYAGLGETDTAMVYLMRCIRIVPEHAEACGTAGFIEESKGHIEKAVEYFEKSIKRGFSKTVYLKLRKLKKGRNIANLIRPRIKLPEYFNQFKYDLPPQCLSTNNAVMAEAEHNAFRKMIAQQAQKFGAMYQELAQKQMEKGMAIMNAGGIGRKLNPNEFMAQPFYELCQIMADQVLSDYKKELGEFHSKTIKIFASDMAALEDEYQQKYKAMMDAFEARCSAGEGASHANCATEEEICSAKNALANTYLPLFADITAAMQVKGKRIFRTYFDELVYWHYLSLNPISKDDFRIQYYYFIEQYLGTMAGICTTKIIKPCITTTVTTTKESNAIKDVDCPLDFGISFIVGNIELNCEKFSIEGGEVLMFKYERDFKTKSSTMNIGIGVNIDLGKGFNAGVQEYAFIKFDGNGGFSDAGIKTEASAEAGIGIIGVKAEVGSTLGIESGWTFNEGPLKGILDPKPEVPLNKM